MWCGYGTNSTLDAFTSLPTVWHRDPHEAPGRVLGAESPIAPTFHNVTSRLI
jgi:hypothetical protein